MSMAGTVRVPPPVNEPVFDYAPGDPERAALKSKLAEMSGQEIEIPLIIGGEEVRTGDLATCILPHDHGHVVARYHLAGPAEVEAAVQAAMEARRDWASWPWEARASVFLTAADLLADRWRSTINAATMLGQSKTCHQAEIDAACETIDFFRFNAHFAQQIYSEQPHSPGGIWNWADYRPLDGFVYAVSPFNFTAIGGNLTASPALMGNSVVWKPSHSAVYSNYFVMRVFEEAGLPPGVVNFVPGDPRMVTRVVMGSENFGGIHFTGSTDVFRSLWQEAAGNLPHYRSYPRIVGETGGKDFLIAHASADAEALVTAMLRGAFEYQGQKCSALSRAYIPESLWERIGDQLVEETEGIAMGDPADFGNFMSAVIHRQSFDKIAGYIKGARNSNEAEILAGGEADDGTGYFIRPTVIRAHRPDYRTMCEEIFGPVLSVFVYPDRMWSETLEQVDGTSPYGLTGAVFARDRRAVEDALNALRFAAGNFYVNDKPTGAVVGQQPFGGGRASGTNDKAGSKLNLLRWVSPRSVKETFAPPTRYRYPFMAS